MLSSYFLQTFIYDILLFYNMNEKQVMMLRNLVSIRSNLRGSHIIADIDKVIKREVDQL